MTDGISQAKVNNGFKLYEIAQKKLESAKLQTQAVQDEFKNIQGQAAEVKALDENLAKQIMVLSNFNVKSQEQVGEAPVAPKEPDKVSPPSGKCPEVSDSASVAPEVKIKQKEDRDAWKAQETKYNKYINEDIPKYKQEKEQYEKDKAAYEARVKEFSQYEALRKDIEAKAPDDVKANLTKLMDAAQAKETELKQAQGDNAELQREVDYSWQSYQELEAQLKDAQFEIKLEKDGDNLTKVAKDKLNLTDTNAVYNGIVAGDKANGADTSKYAYTHMKIGDGRTYTADQIKAMGADLDLSDDLGADFGAEMNKLLDNAPIVEIKPNKPQDLHMHVDDASGGAPQSTDPNEHYHSGGVTKARGIPYNDKKTDADWGYKDNGDGTFTSLSDPTRTLTKDQLNEAMRNAENTVHSGYSKLLDKAENYEIDIDATVKGKTGDEAYKAIKDAVKAKEAEEKAAKKLNKAEQKYADEIQKYGISVDDYSNASELKAAIKAAKKQPQQKISLEPDGMATKPKDDNIAMHQTLDTVVVLGQDKSKIDVSTLDQSARDAINGVKNQVGTRQNLYIDGKGYIAHSDYSGNVTVTGNDGKKYKLSEDGTKLIPS